MANLKEAPNGLQRQELTQSIRRLIPCIVKSDPNLLSLFESLNADYQGVVFEGLAYLAAVEVSGREPHEQLKTRKLSNGHELVIDPVMRRFASQLKRRGDRRAENRIKSIRSAVGQVLAAYSDYLE